VDGDEGVAALRISATGKCLASSQATALGAKVSAAKARATSRTAIWSASSANCVDAVEIESSISSCLQGGGAPLLHCRFAAANGVLSLGLGTGALA